MTDVFADKYAVGYYNCSNVEIPDSGNIYKSFSDNSSSDNSDIISKFKYFINNIFKGSIPDYIQVVDTSQSINYLKCNDEDFTGWVLKVSHGLSCLVNDASNCYKYVYCSGSGRHQSDDYTCSNGDSFKILSNDEMNSFNFGSDDVVIFTAVKKNSSLYNNYRCSNVSGKNECINNGCTWNDKYSKSFCSPNGLVYLSCGNSKDIPEIVPTLISYAVTLLKTVAPIVLIVISIISLVKAITAGKEDEIKKAQGTLLKRVIYAGLVFFTISIVQFIMLKVADSSEKDDLSSCLSCFLNGKSDCGNLYYKQDNNKCYYIDNGREFNCE